MIALSDSQYKSPAFLEVIDQGVDMKMKLVFLFLIIISIVFSINAFCDGYKQRYLKGFLHDPNIPRWCRYTQYGDLHGKDRGKFLKKFGHTWIHIHHYCGGLYEIDYAIQHPENAAFHLLQGIGGFNYVLERMPRDHFFRHHVLFNKAKALMLLQNYAEAAKQYIEIIKIKSDYVPAYIGLSNAFLLMGDKGSALKVLKQANKKFPSNRVIKNQIMKLQK